MTVRQLLPKVLHMWSVWRCLLSLGSKTLISPRRRCLGGFIEPSSALQPRWVPIKKWVCSGASGLLPAVAHWRIFYWLRHPLWRLWHQWHLYYQDQQCSGSDPHQQSEGPLRTSPRQAGIHSVAVGPLPPLLVQSSACAGATEANSGHRANRMSLHRGVETGGQRDLVLL